MLEPMIGDRLKELRVAAGMTQAQFAAIVDTTKQYVSQLELGKNTMPSGEYVEGWARHCNVTVRWLVSGNGTKRPEPGARGQPRPVLLDAEIVESTHVALAQMYENRRRVYPREDVARFLLVYEKLAMQKAGVSEADVFGPGLPDTISTQVESSERVVSVRSKEAHPATLARRVRRKT